MSEHFDVLSSAQFIASQSRDVIINDAGIQKGVDTIFNNWSSFVGEQDSNNLQHLEPPGLTDTEALEWTFLADTLNFCFWSDDKLFTVEFDGQQYTGYFSLLACLHRAVKEGIKIYQPSVYGHLTLTELKHIFRSCNNTEIPLIEKRLENLHEAAAVLDKVFNGSVVELVQRADKSVQKLIKLLIDNFSSYRDVGTYKGKQVAFLKRAQIFASDTWSRFGQKGYGEFYDVNTLTMFADYRVPQGLLDIGALKYSDNLHQTLQKGIHLLPGSDEEMEIRGCSILAIEMIRKRLIASDRYQSIVSTTTKQKSSIFACEIDYFFWRYAKDHSQEFPFHKTLTIFY